MSSGSGRIDVSNFFSPPPPPDPKVTIVFGMIVKEGEDDIIIENRFKAVALEELGEQEIKHQQDARAAAERNLLEQEVYHGGSVSVRKKSRNATASNSTTNG